MVLTGEGGGNSAIDMMLTLQECERIGIKTTVITYELGGPEGKDFPLVDSRARERTRLSAPESATRPLCFPAIGNVLAVGRISIPSSPRRLKLREIMLDKVYCSTNQSSAWDI